MKKSQSPKDSKQKAKEKETTLEEQLGILPQEEFLKLTHAEKSRIMTQEYVMMLNAKGKSKKD